MEKARASKKPPTLAGGELGSVIMLARRRRHAEASKRCAGVHHAQASTQAAHSLTLGRLCRCCHQRLLPAAAAVAAAVRKPRRRTREARPRRTILTRHPPSVPLRPDQQERRPHDGGYRTPCSCCPCCWPPTLLDRRLRLCRRKMSAAPRPAAEHRLLLLLCRPCPPDGTGAAMPRSRRCAPPCCWPQASTWVPSRADWERTGRIMRSPIPLSPTWLQRPKVKTTLIPPHPSP